MLKYINHYLARFGKFEKVGAAGQERTIRMHPASGEKPSRNRLARKEKPTTIKCDGTDCQKTQTLRPSKIHPARFYVCSGKCGHTLERLAGTIRIIEQHAAGGFYGVTDREPSEPEAASVNRANDILNRGLAQRANGSRARIRRLTANVENGVERGPRLG
jgi:hypothetical protein